MPAFFYLTGRVQISQPHRHRPAQEEVISYDHRHVLQCPNEARLIKTKRLRLVVGEASGFI